MHARIGTFDVPPSRLNDAVSFLRDRGVTAFSACEGFLGYQAYVDRERGRLVGISLRTTRAVLDASGDTASGILRDAAVLGATNAGERQILELTFDSRKKTG